MTGRIALCLIALYGLAIAYCVALSRQQRVIQVVPDIPNYRYDQENCTVEECYSMSSLMQTGMRASNLKVEFLPGTHIVNISGVYRNNAAIYNFALSAANLTVGATILCNGKYGFALSKVMNLIISGLTFEYCGGIINLWPHTIPWYFTLYVGHSENVIITTVTVRYGRGDGIFVEDSYGNFTLFRTNLTLNERNFFFTTHDHSYTNYHDLNVNIVEATFTHSHQTRGLIYDDGIRLRLLHKQFNVAVHIINIFMDVQCM